MKPPADDSSPQEHRRSARYSRRKLRRAKLQALVDAIDADLLVLDQKVDALGAAQDAYEDAIADRDAVDDDGDDLVQAIGLGLRSRTANAAKEPPHTDVFPEGIDGVLDLPVSGVPAGLRGLRNRIGEHLPPEDPIQAKTPALAALADTYQQAEAAAADAAQAVSNALSAIEGAKRRLRATLERIYGELVVLYGRRKAERFFKRRRTAAKKAEPTA